MVLKKFNGMKFQNNFFILLDIGFIDLRNNVDKGG